MKIERIREDGEPRRRFFLIAEVTFADREAEDEPGDNYYEDSELEDLVANWFADALEDRDDLPEVRFRDMPEKDD